MTKAKDTILEESVIYLGSFDTQVSTADACIEHVLKCAAKRDSALEHEFVEHVDTPFSAGFGLRSFGAYKSNY